LKKNLFGTTFAITAAHQTPSAMSPNAHDTNAGTEPEAHQTLKIPVIEERLVTGTERVETGRVQISKKVTEEEAFYEGIITSEEVEVERKEMNRYVDSVPEAVRQEGDVTIISVLKEVLVVEKKMMLVEEIHIKKRRSEINKTFTETLRKEEVTISRSASGTDFDHRAD
jgi:uncharacterized protein (TIGR02271 family)